MFNKNERSLLLLDGLKSCVAVFIGPFLTAFFIKKTIDNLGNYALFNVVTYSVSAIISILVCLIIKKRNKMDSLRVGIVSNMLFLYFIAKYQDEIIGYPLLIGALQGIGVATYYMPYNYFIVNEIREEKMAEWFTYKSIINNILQVIIPLLIGFLLMSRSYSSASYIFILLEVLMFIITFTFNCKSKSTNSYSLVKYRNAIKEHKLMDFFRTSSFIEILAGFTISSSCLETIITLYIVKFFKTSSSLGILTSIFVLVKVILVYLFGKFSKEKSYPKYMWISSTLVCIGIALFGSFTGRETLIVYNFFYACGAVIMLLIIQINSMILGKNEAIKRNYQMEYLSIHEGWLSLGRIISYLLLFLVVMFNNYGLILLLLFIYSFAFILLAILNTKTIKKRRHQ